MKPKQPRKPVERKQTCKWREDEDGNWQTTCGNLFVLISETPQQNGMKFCCYCGGRLK